MKQKEIALVCFQILGRHFPGESGNDNPELRTILEVDSSISGTPDKAGMSADAAKWKEAATNWLINNISFSFKKEKKRK